MPNRPCQGGFCHLHLPSNTACCSSHNKQTLSKREKRLLKSIQRDRATKLLQWTLREEEYSRLEENGDLVRLRVRDVNADGVGCWVNGETVRLAVREHRPELAQLAFAEFSSQLDEGCVNGTVNVSWSDAPVLIEPPSHVDEMHDNALVCGVCSTVYHLLEQARELLSSYDDLQQQEVEVMSENGNAEGCDNCDESQPAEAFSASINQVDDVPQNALKKSKTEGPQSKKWADVKQESSLQSRSLSFHGSVNTWPGAPPASVVGKKRDRKQMEENAKIRILVAESDDVSSCKVSSCVFVRHLFSSILQSSCVAPRQHSSWPNGYSKNKATK